MTIRRKDVDTFIKLMEKLTEGKDTTNEMRDTSSYQFMLGLCDALNKDRGMPLALASDVTSSLTVDLPSTLHQEYPEHFARLIDLWATFSATFYHTLQEDFVCDLADKMLMNLIKESHVEFVV